MALGDYLNCVCHACIGGTNVRADILKLQATSPQIVVGTPGRVFDMIKRKVVRKFHISQLWQRASAWPYFTSGANELTLSVTSCS